MQSPLATDTCPMLMPSLVLSGHLHFRLKLISGQPAAVGLASFAHNARDKPGSSRGDILAK